MKIGILQTGHAPDNLLESMGDYDVIYQKMLAGHGFDFDAYAVVDGEFPTDADAADGWIITGSRFGAYEDHPWIPPLEDLIRDIAARNLPLIGVCFGHQIIAQALGGKVEKFKDGWAVGRTEYRLGDKTVTLNAWHQDQVTGLPENARVIGGNAFCKNAFLAYGDTIWTVQPHPEYDAAFVDGLIRTRGRGVISDDVLDAASARLDGPTDNSEMAEFMAEFFKRKSVR
ncbi:type 1 glutamine amidotransferase [Sedimentitalea sp. JM2-8]|uniref:Type 1 glutamine amidotransferase n=1 Tax=Sedimentitalea xiamensis TaxID=3050037 RepID=A0ABT7FDE1_9RHOB|nr:type 1 glutamine amidotransferase [Sedimentitalea xiamensis]MDK3073133.1 type 1 glutamine amidotransferase [Sedimentitalea xiamensis]